VDPQPLRKKIADITDLIARENEDTEQLIAGIKGAKTGLPFVERGKGSMARQELAALISSLTEQMRGAADELQFELAGRLRDEIKELKRELRSMDEAGH
jgi:excinuclease ABC subunit B